jgi:hypothetical protein
VERSRAQLLDFSVKILPGTAAKNLGGDASLQSADRFSQSAIASVINQVYPNWELCIADDCSTDFTVAENLKNWAKRTIASASHFVQKTATSAQQLTAPPPSQQATSSCF